MTKETNQIPADNYFSLLALAISFDIDKEKLNKNYHEIQKSIHPDNFANSSDLERRLSVQKAAQVNDALATLKDPLKRAIYLLSLHGIELNENDNKMDPVFLMEQMDLRENLAQVEKHDEPMTVLDKILQNVQDRIKNIVKEIAQLFKRILSDEQMTTAEQLLVDVKSNVLKMQFLNRLLQECLDKEEDLANQY